jgi:hypothetical protein
MEEYQIERAETDIRFKEKQFVWNLKHDVDRQTESDSEMSHQETQEDLGGKFDFEFTTYRTAISKHIHQQPKIDCENRPHSNKYQ